MLAPPPLKDDDDDEERSRLFPVATVAVVPRHLTAAIAVAASVVPDGDIFVVSNAFLTVAF